MRIITVFLIEVIENFHLFEFILFFNFFLDSCLHTVHFEDVVNWRPNCEKDGSYSAKQCRGDKITGRCFCFAQTGAKIYGWDWWTESDNMTCGKVKNKFN